MRALTKWASRGGGAGGRPGMPWVGGKDCAYVFGGMGGLGAANAAYLLCGSDCQVCGNHLANRATGRTQSVREPDGALKARAYARPVAPRAHKPPFSRRPTYMRAVTMHSLCARRRSKRLAARSSDRSAAALAAGVAQTSAGGRLAAGGEHDVTDATSKQGTERAGANNVHKRAASAAPVL